MRDGSVPSVRAPYRFGYDSDLCPSTQNLLSGLGGPARARSGRRTSAQRVGPKWLLLGCPHTAPTAS